jgi:uncharacterized protein
MTRAAAIQEHADEIRALVRRRRAANPRVFGSVLRREDGEASDIDILVDALPGATLFDLGALQMDLEDLLEAPVDLLTPRDLSPALRDRILTDALAI